jgi:integrase
MTPAELARLGAALRAIERDDPTRRMACEAIRLLALTGARRNEVLDLRWEYIDEARGCAWLPTSKTGKKMLRLGEAGIALLKSLPGDSDWCFPSTRGSGPLRDLRKVLEAAREKANEDIPAKDRIASFRIHDLRHSCKSSKYFGQEMAFAKRQFWISA